MSEDTQKPWWHDSLMSFFKISAWIVFPIVFGVILGSYLDARFNTGSVIEICLTGLLFIFSVYHMVQDGKHYEEEIDHHDHPEKYITHETEDK